MATALVSVAEVVEEPKTWPRVVTLKHPIDFAGERIASLEFRRGRIGDLKGMKLGDTVPAEQLVLIASRLSGKPVPLIEMLDVDDAGEVMSIALDFFGKCLSAGKTP
jgi:hypothetical protein